MAASLGDTIAGRLQGRAVLLIGDSAAQATWESLEPVDSDIFLNLQTNVVCVWDAESGVSDEYPLGGVNGVYNATAPSSGNTATISALIGAKVQAVDRGGIGIELVSGTPNDGQIAFDTLTGVFTLGSNDAFGGEWLRIWYTWAAI